MSDDTLPTLRKLLRGSPARKVSEKRALFFSLEPQILRWLDEGHTRVAIRAHLAKQGLQLSRSTFHRYLRAGHAGGSASIAEPLRPPQCTSPAKPRTRRGKPQATATEAPRRAPVRPEPSAVAQPPATTPRLTLDLLKPINGAKRQLLGSFTPPPPIPLDEL